VLTVANHEIERLKIMRKALDKLKRGLMQKLMTGEARV
jgi:hypothetical protein